ncbi:response regulator [Faecalicatena sp. AGMB00832]|uniref:Response regulator n=1 Tax=Faecalicatena faecalis TaxID=2726362 RepID=A0ABS6CY22_9FIRM|nr:response regulator [Faecalicatena faecalis]MBU3874220.1 response regulator [Faecalicatena faecalis]
MLNIVLVDDEQLIIHHLIKIISSFDIPHKIVGTANNNQQALTIIRETHPNLVITDIRMGASNGLDLCDTLKVTMPHTKVIILSGFDDFTYAQKALSYNVFNYLLKPINEKDLYDQLTQVQEILEKEKEAEAKDFMLKEQLQECLPLMQEWFFKIIRENLDHLEIIDSTFRLFNIDILNESYQSLYIDFSQDNDEAQAVEKDFLNVSRLAQTIMLFIGDYFKTIYFYDTSSITIILSSENTQIEEVHQRSYHLADRIRQYLDFNYPRHFSIGLSTTVQNISSLRQSVKDAIAASKYSFYIGFNEIICITDVELRNTGETIPNFKYIQEDLLKYVKLCDLPHCEQYLNIFYLNVLQLHGDRSLATNKFLELYYYLSNALNQEFDLGHIPSQEVVSQIKSCTNLEEIKNILSHYITGSIREIEQMRTTKSRKLIDRAKAYIQENYAHDISLESIAFEIGLSACYLSTLFKNIEKTSIKEYIIDVRIEASKQYLLDIDLKIYEVAANVGYTDSRYFSQLFRKKTGYTPGQYREFMKSGT